MTNAPNTVDGYDEDKNLFEVNDDYHFHSSLILKSFFLPRTEHLHFRIIDI